MATLLLVRHGHTRGNRAHGSAPLSGWYDVPLDARGEAEARAVGVRLARHPAARLVFCSPLVRARATAEEIARAARSVLAPRDGLREIHCGVCEGLPIAEVERRFAHAWRENLRQADPEFRWPGGESYAEFRARVVAALDAIAAEVDADGGAAVVVTHAGVISQAIGSLVGTGPAVWEKHRPGNASLTELRWGRGGRELVAFDDQAHLVADAV